MKMFLKGAVFGIAAAIFLSVVLVPTAFATEGLPGGGAPIASASEASPVDKMPKLSTSTPSNPEGPVAPEPDTVATAEELMEWLCDHENIGGTVWLSADISLCDVTYIHNLRKPAITIETGEFSITVNGSVELRAGSPFIIRGSGGGRGALRVSEGGMLFLDSLTLEAEDGFVAFQEEGSGFMMENTSVTGEIHYAEQPFIWEWESGLTVVERGEAFDEGQLPAVLLARVNFQGQTTDGYEEVPVNWDLAGHEEECDLRQRFTVSGEFENKASQNAPYYTVVYDDFPLTFLEVGVRKIRGNYGDAYRFTGGFSKPEGRLPITVAQEYSFDGENWTLYEETTAEAPGSGFHLSPFVKAEDRERFSEIFIRLCWDDGGTVYYSNVLRFEADSLLAKEEPGGNRGGGTDIVDPPKPPGPDLEPGTTLPGLETTLPETDSGLETIPPPAALIPAPGRPGDSGADHESDGEGAASSREKSGGSCDDGKESSHEGVAQIPSLPGGPSEQKSAPPISAQEPNLPATIPESEAEHRTETGARLETELEPELGIVSEQIPPDEAMASSSIIGEEDAMPEADMLPVAAGLAAVAVSIGGAAFYLHPKLWRKLFGMLRKDIR